MRYKAIVQYRFKVRVEVEAQNEEEADILAVEAADEEMAQHASVYDVELEEVL